MQQKSIIAAEAHATHGEIQEEETKTKGHENQGKFAAAKENNAAKVQELLKR
jgi:hypothetical protein